MYDFTFPRLPLATRKWKITSTTIAEPRKKKNRLSMRKCRRLRRYQKRRYARTLGYSPNIYYWDEAMATNKTWATSSNVSFTASNYWYKDPNEEYPREDGWGYG